VGGGGGGGGGDHEGCVMGRWGKTIKLAQFVTVIVYCIIHFSALSSTA
jgi:hypothetical protein